MLVKLTFHTTRPVINRQSLNNLLSIPSPPRISSGWGKAAPHHLQLFPPRPLLQASATGLVSTLYPLYLSSLFLLNSACFGLAKIWRGNIHFFSWCYCENVESRRCWTHHNQVGRLFSETLYHRHQRQQITGLPWKSTRLQSSSDTWVSLCSLHTRHRLTPTQSSSPWEHIRSLTAPPHQPSITWRLKARSCYVNIK